MCKLSENTYTKCAKLCIYTYTNAMTEMTLASGNDFPVEMDHYSCIIDGYDKNHNYFLRPKGQQT